MGGSQTAVTADDFNDYFLSIPHKTVANVVSAVSPTVYMDRLFDVDIPTFCLYLLMLSQCL